MLRRIVKRIHFQHFDRKHGGMFVTDSMLDQRIEAIGPEVVGRMVRSGVDGGLL